MPPIALLAATLMVVAVVPPSAATSIVPNEPTAPCTRIVTPSADVRNNTLRIQSALDAASLVPGGGCVSLEGGDYPVLGTQWLAL